MTKLLASRRRVLGGLAAGLALPALVTAARAAAPIDAAADYGVAADTGADQTANLQAALRAAQSERRRLTLPGGTIIVSDLDIPGALRLLGQPGATVLSSPGPRVGRILHAENLVIDGIGFEARAGDARAIVEIEASAAISFVHCRFSGGPLNAISSFDSEITVEDCDFRSHPNAAIHSMDGRGIMVRGNRIRECGNAGVQIWRSTQGRDGSIVTGNRIARIDWIGGGNGQNGNGVNVYLADEVIVADNHIADCAFTAVRVNTCRNTQVRGNTCLNSGEVAIFSEFGFSGSVIADNIIDGAATGIDITNLDTGGYLATCTGNIVRNIFPRSAVNPDTVPVGIYAEADTVVAGNVIENVPGVGIAAGYGPFIRNVTLSGNSITGADIGIGVTVVRDERVGPALITGNIVSKAARAGVAGLEWQDIATPDLIRDVAAYPHITVAANVVR
jgi:uncharacterized secreted repeat protein (TIGR03808 family)